MTTASTVMAPLWSRRQVEPIWLVLIAVLIAALAITTLSGESMLSSTSLRTIAIGSTALGFVAVGQTLAMVVGSFDLSVAWTVTLGAVVTAAVMDGQAGMAVPAVVAALAAGGVVGAVNGLVIARLGVNPLIATLGTALLLNGALNALVEGRVGSVSEGFREFGYGSLGAVPLSFVVLVIVAVAAHLWLRRSRTGHHVYAIGGSQDIARASGIRVERVIVAAHVVCSILAALAGVYLASRLGGPDTGVGTRGGYDLESIAVVVLGGTALGGGRGGVPGTVAAVVIFAVLEVVLNVLGVDPFAKTIVEGLVIIAAVASYQLRRTEPAR
ncbi:ABC transporter permease [Euzebya tangerina]|uniref:ABC transporter permease n=1 Tax=Euzebya tangerina TaxID=591198 RepID=UPI000E30CDD0|nr:ABC transporter permease [Euzebya tangerina]